MPFQAMNTGILAGEDGGKGNIRRISRTERIIKNSTLRRHGVDIRRQRLVIPIAAKVLRPEGVADD